MSDYVPKDHEIRAAAINHRAPLIHRQMLGQTVRDAEKVATDEYDRWLNEVERAAAVRALRVAALKHESAYGEIAPGLPLLMSTPTSRWLRAEAERREGTE